MANTHELDEDDRILIPLFADRGRLKVFSKKGAITGSDLVTIKSGKGKRAELSTLYFGKSESGIRFISAHATPALRFNVPHKIWSNDRWDDPSSDADFEEKPTKGKGKAQPKPKPLSTRQSTRRAAVKEDVIELQSDGGNGEEHTLVLFIMLIADRS